jgi:hypothetical protein
MIHKLAIGLVELLGILALLGSLTLNAIQGTQAAVVGTGLLVLALLWEVRRKE